MEYSEGDIVVYRSMDARRVRVDTKEDDIKNGRPGFGGTLLSSNESDLYPGDLVWGYDSDIIRVERG